MSWESIVLGALQGFSNFVNSFVSLIGSSINAEATEGLIAVFAIVLIYRVAQGGTKIPGKIIERVRKKKPEDEDEYEFIRVRRRS